MEEQVRPASKSWPLKVFYHHYRVYLPAPVDRALDVGAGGTRACSPYGSCALYVYALSFYPELLASSSKTTQATERGLKGLGASRADGWVFGQTENGTQKPLEPLAEPAAALLS